jgi:dipeptidase D
MTLLVSGLFASCGEEVPSEKPEDTTKTEILKKFTEVSKIPRDNQGSMKSISKYLIDQAEKLKLKATTDEAGNIMIEKPAGSAYKKTPTTILQTNMDMVVNASPSIVFDPSKDSINPVISKDDNSITGEDTNLGASSGLGIATALNILEKSTTHGAIKAVFTVDGEGNLKGARKIDPDFIAGDYLINLNNTNSGVIDNSSSFSSILETSEKLSLHNTTNKYALVMAAEGFTGGNSSVDDTEEKGNPILFLAEVLATAKSQAVSFELNDIKSDGNGSSIPKSAKAVVTVNDYEKIKITSIFNQIKKDYVRNHDRSDPNIELELIETKVPDKAFDGNDVNSLISFLYAMVGNDYNKEEQHVIRSSDVSALNIKGNRIICDIFVQSNIENGLDEIMSDHQQIAKISKIKLRIKNKVSGYNTPKSAPLMSILTDIYKTDMDIDVTLGYIPYRVEQDYFKSKMPDLEMVSIGSEIESENNLNESVELNSVYMPAKVITSFLAKIAQK